MLAATRIFVLLIAVYLLLISVLTMQIFDEKNDESQFVLLERNLADIGRTTPVAIKTLSKSVDSDVSQGISLIKTDLEKKNVELLRYLVEYDSKLAFFREYLNQQPSEFQAFSDDERRRLLLRFREQGRRNPLIYMEKYSEKLQSFFEKWIDGWISKQGECRAQTVYQTNLLGELIRSTAKALIAPVDTAPDPRFPDLKLTGPRFPNWPPPELKEEDLRRSCDLSSLTSTPIPPIDGDDKRIGPLDFLYDWLVRAESRTLTLIIGLIGFGIFGAMFSSYIQDGRESLDTFRDFVRGIASAILVYLLVVGGLTVITKDATPNPYALFAACFIASVFSSQIFVFSKEKLGL